MLRLVTYNIHKCRGLDRRVRPGRIAEVLRETNADVIALQEVLSIEGAAAEKHQARFIAHELGMDYRIAENRRLDGGAYGNVILSRLPIAADQNHDITWRGREQRGCHRADSRWSAGGPPALSAKPENKDDAESSKVQRCSSLTVKEGSVPALNPNPTAEPNSQSPNILHIFNVHLGTAFIERRYQARHLIGEEILNNKSLHGPRVILGDFNEWTRGLATKLLAEHFKSADLRHHLQRARTYPGVLPFLHLDHVYYDDKLELKKLALHRSRTALIASDHLPLVADFDSIA
jgi:endonuclease/exonuclease/phosphatase family metal-dependent hydrolase